MDAYLISLVILWISFVATLPLVTWAFKTRDTNWGRFLAIWFFTSVITGIILTGLMIAPDFITSTLEKIKLFFS